ncbi:class I SAM-dependent methyltransferase [Polymorphum gilvum]|uniref:Methyltransferase small domain family n=1 Tax=Polymorphum gilvum (strain LMG 25793 / CGMCC 1.9160 / SL003B-26A1) TaxID=991905 RepID=F2IWA5_POLGS|nr:class I SAM-dependent methyltransferase [Polymorphum gilvum]ADZ71490.1 Methyltransferase small domain family [Polymorphum gilvum SL003B-26A1]
MTDPALDTLLLPLEAGNLALPAEGRALFLRARAGPALGLFPRDRLVCEQTFAPDRDALLAAGCEVVEAAEGRFALVLVLPPRQKQEARALLARAVDLATDGGVVVACVPNTEGARACEADLATLAGPVDKLSKHKCRVFWATVTERTVDAALLADWRVLDAPRAILDGRFVSRPGVFSWDHVDPASALLAERLPATLAGRGADLGAGFGYLAAVVLDTCPKVAALDLYEAEKRALDLARENLESVAAGRALGFHWQDVTRGLKGPYDFVVMNPPFHHGGKADRADIGQAFIRAAAGGLRPGGSLWMVANRHLPYERTLGELYASVDMVADEGGYKVLHAVKARRQG